MIVIDTDHFSVITDSRHRRHLSLIARLASVDEPVLIPIVAVEEQLRAWLAQISRVGGTRRLVDAYERLARLIEVLAEWDISLWTDESAAEFNRLRAQRVRIGTQDLRIASIALANDALLLSANLRDFERVPTLRVQDWLAE